MSDTSIDPKQVEILAFNLSRDFALSAAEAQVVWQENPELRANSRERAEKVIRELSDTCGLKLRVSDSRLQAAFLNWLVTIPPRPAYDAKELAALNQV